MRDVEQRRVVITGLGVLTAAGQDPASLWEAVRLGQSGAGLLTRFDASKTPTKIAAELKDFDSSRFLDAKTAKWMDAGLLYSVCAAQLAASDAKLDLEMIDPERIGVVEGTSVSNNEAAFEATAIFERRGYRGISPYSLINGHAGGGSSEIARRLGIKGHAITCSTSSASGNDAVGYAFKMIKVDDVDVMLAGGSEAPLNPGVWGALSQGRVMSSRNENPQAAMRPFDRDRDGFVLGEGSGFLVVEELGHALNRNAKIYAEIIGHGRSCEAFHPVSQNPDGVDIARAIDRALRDAGLHGEEVDYINAHGTATDSNDVIETKAIKQRLGKQAKRLAVSSTKPITGHLMAAAGAVETVICALVLQHQEIPPTINLENADPGCDLDYVRGQSRPYPVRVVLNLNSGFGGKNACLVLKYFAPDG